MNKDYISMTFASDNYKRKTLNIKHPNQYVQDYEVRNVMDIIINSNAFIVSSSSTISATATLSSSGTLVFKDSAKYVSVTERPFVIG